MTTRFGINGFGRMGRLALRALTGESSLKCTRINELACDAHTSAHLLTFDSVHGRWLEGCAGEGDVLEVAGQSIRYSSSGSIDPIAWRDCDIVIEATGMHHKQQQTLQKYFDQGVRKVVVAAPTRGALNLVYGVNHHLYDAQYHHLLSAASCTTNCLAPVVKVMHEHFGIVHGSMTTIHDITNTQSIVDRGHKDLRRARACGQSLIPTSTGSARAITEIFPELAGKLNGHAIRVPLLNASLTDFVFESAVPVSAHDVNAAFASAAEGELNGILGYEVRPLVSVDYVNDPRSAVIDAPSTLVVDSTQVKIYAWYDNEWGYANRLADVVRMLAVSMPAHEPA